MTNIARTPLRVSLWLGAALALAGCENGMDFGTVGDMFGGNRPQNGAEVLPRPDPDARGVITYSTYQVMVARNGDTVASMAQRVNLDPAELARHNGLSANYAPRPGEVLALPRNVGGSINDNVWSPQIASTALDNIETQPLGAPASAPANVAGDNPFNNGQAGTVVNPIRHRVRAGETAFSIARLYSVSVTALSQWNGLDSQMTLRPDQELLIPVTANQRNGSATQAAAVNDPGTPSPVTAPPSSTRPLPPNQDIDAAQKPPAPDLSSDLTKPRQTAAASSGKLLLPIAGAKVLRPYAASGPRKNEGIDFAAPAGTEVRAAGDGEVALISESLGGLGTIVLIRHPDNLMTVYGRVTGVSLKKGDLVKRGQRVGVVAKGDTPNLHFEIRRGTASVDPKPYL
ncbi:peptidoglycan DD-metalloendopeptidase family protein [Halovulum sp. GXIMD14793]